MKRVLVVLTTLAGVGVLAACGVPVQDTATATDADDVPFGLVDEASAQPSPTIPAPGEAAAAVYLVDPDGDRLLAVGREIEGDDPSDVVAALLAGPSDDEAALGVTTALPDDDAVVSVDVVGGVAAVDLATTFTSSTASSQRLALAQIVYTLTALPGVGRVSFTVEGQSVEIPRGDGTLTTGSVSRDSYRELEPA